MGSVKGEVRGTEVTELVAEMLGVPVDAIDPHADLIAQGFDSIRMMALAGRWRSQGIEVDFAALAAAPSVGAWAALLDSASPMQPPQRATPLGNQEGFPLAPMQHALWVGRNDNQQLGGVAAHLYVEFDGELVDPGPLQVAANQLAARHPMLRVQFLPDGTQRIAEFAELPVSVEDLRGTDAAAVALRLAAIRESKSHQQLDDAVLELCLTLLPGDRSRLHVDLDMQAADAMSYRTLLDDLAVLHSGLSLPELNYTYRDYLANVERVREPAQERDRRWWAPRVAELHDPPTLPLASGAGTDTQSSERTNSHQSTRRWHWLDPKARNALYDCAQRRGVTPSMALAASFADAVAGWSADPRFLLNVPLFGREPMHPDVPKLVGDFTTSLLLNVDLTNADTAAQRAAMLQKDTHTAAAHSAYPGLSVLRDLNRHRGSQVLAPVVFTSALGLGDLFSTNVTTQFGNPVWMISQGPQVLLDAQVTEFDGGLLINWDVREQMFAPGVIDAMFSHHIDEVKRLAATDAAWEEARQTLVPPAQQRVRKAVNAVVAQRDPHVLYDGLVDHAVLHPDAPAVLFRDGQWTYAQLSKRAGAVAATLQADGMQPGDTVAVLGPKGVEQIPALLGILMAGGVYLPVGVDQPADRAARILVTGRASRALVCGTDLPEVPMPAMSVTAAISRGFELDFRPPASDPESLAYVLFTSGSTGEPKGVEVPHSAAMNTVEFLNDHFGIDSADRCLALSTLECDMSVLDIFGTLTAGGAIVVVDEQHRRDPDQWVQLIQAHGVTVLNFLPGWLEMLVKVAPDRALSSLRVVPTGGDRVWPALVHRLRSAAPRLRFAGVGGATETAVHGTICEVVDQPPEDWTAVPYGVPFPNNVCRVVNPQGSECPDWVPGELWIGGRGIARGYRGREDLTAQRFLQKDGVNWYRTGDTAKYHPDGTLEFVGRADDRVKISGYRIELGDVEATLRRVPGISAAVAASMPMGNGEQLGALVVCHPPMTPDAIRSALAQLVPAHMVPQRIRVLDAIPYTVGGKVNRAAVAQLLDDSTDQTSPVRAPTTALERALVDILADILGKSRIGIDHDFFSLGGDSVSATAAVARIRTWLDTPELMVADIFATRTVTALATLLYGRDKRLEQVAEVFLEVAAMDAAEVVGIKDRVIPTGFAPWIRRFSASGGSQQSDPGGIVVFPHAGGDAATYRSLATSFAALGSEVFVAQYPQHPGRLSDAPAQTIGELAEGIFAAGPWENAGPLRLFGHCMGSAVAFEFAKIAERHGVMISKLWVSGGAAPSAMAHLPSLPTTDDAILSDITQLGGTDPRLLADSEFLDLLIPAVRADYLALNCYSRDQGDTVNADIGAISGSRDDRIDVDLLHQWESHTTGQYGLHSIDGGHFFLFENLDYLGQLVHSDV